MTTSVDNEVEPASERLEGLLAGFAPQLGGEAVAYGNHVRRVFGLVRAQGPWLSSEELEQVAVAAVFHDIGVWTDHTFDYLGPSREHATDYLRAEGLTAWEPLISRLILEHHKIRPVKGSPLVEAFRRADLCDLSLGTVQRGIPAGEYAHLRAMFPVAGFHWFLVKLATKRAITHPLSPAPMMRW